jgi:hypothetical protein
VLAIGWSPGLGGSAELVGAAFGDGAVPGDGTADAVVGAADPVVGTADVGLGAPAGPGPARPAVGEDVAVGRSGGAAPDGALVAAGEGC